MKKIMFAVPQHAAEFIESANLEAEGITQVLTKSLLSHKMS